MTDVPAYQDLLWPAVQAMRELGDSGSIDEIIEKVLEQENVSETQQSVLHGDGPGTEIAYRLAWARSYLKGMGLAENSRRVSGASPRRAGPSPSRRSSRCGRSTWPRPASGSACGAGLHEVTGRHRYHGSSILMGQL